MTNSILLTRHNQEIAQWSPDPFPRKRVGSGHETMQPCARPTDLFVVSCPDTTLASVTLSSHMTNGILLTRHNQEIAQWSPDPFPHERVGSGHETIEERALVEYVMGKGFVASWPHTKRTEFWENAAKYLPSTYHPLSEHAYTRK